MFTLRHQLLVTGRVLLQMAQVLISLFLYGHPLLRLLEQLVGRGTEIRIKQSLWKNIK